MNLCPDLTRLSPFHTGFEVRGAELGDARTRRPTPLAAETPMPETATSVETPALAGAADDTDTDPKQPQRPDVINRHNAHCKVREDERPSDERDLGPGRVGRRAGGTSGSRGSRSTRRGSMRATSATSSGACSAEAGRDPEGPRPAARTSR